MGKEGGGTETPLRLSLGDCVHGNPINSFREEERRVQFEVWE